MMLVVEDGSTPSRIPPSTLRPMFRRGWSRVALARPVIFNLDDGTAIKGTLLRETKRLVTLANAELLEDGAPAPVKLDGETVIDSERIRFAQILST